MNIIYIFSNKLQIRNISFPFNDFIKLFWWLTCAIVATVKPKVKEYRTISLSSRSVCWADPQEKNVKIIVPINSANSLLITTRISLTSSRPTFGKILFMMIFFYLWFCLANQFWWHEQKPVDEMCKMWDIKYANLRL